MPFANLDDFILKTTTRGQTFRADWAYFTSNQSGVATVATSLDLSASQGLYGTNNRFPGVAQTWVTCSDSNGNGVQRFGIPHGGDVPAPNTKHITFASYTSHRTGTTAVAGDNGVISQGGVLTLVDLQGYWPGINHFSTATQTLSPVTSLRYANGEGCRLYMVATGIIGSTAHSLRLNYFNTSNVYQNTTNAFIPATATAMRTSASNSAGQIVSGLGLGSGSGGQFLPLVGNDTGVSNVANLSFTASSGLAGAQSALCLARPLLSIHATPAAWQTTEREFTFQTPTLPEVKNGACLVWLYHGYVVPTGVTVFVGPNTSFTGTLETAWG